MIKRLEQLTSSRDWELSVVSGNLILKLPKGKGYQFTTPALAQKFREELETLLRPFLFQLGQEEEKTDFSEFLDELTDPSPNNNNNTP